MSRETRCNWIRQLRLADGLASGGNRSPRRVSGYLAFRATRRSEAIHSRSRVKRVTGSCTCSCTCCSWTRSSLCLRHDWTGVPPRVREGAKGPCLAHQSVHRRPATATTELPDLVILLIPPPAFFVTSPTTNPLFLCAITSE